MKNKIVRHAQNVVNLYGPWMWVASRPDNNFFVKKLGTTFYLILILFHSEAFKNVKKNTINMLDFSDYITRNTK